MDDLTRCLYDFVCEHRMGSVHGDPEFREASLTVDMQTKRLEETMTQEQKQELKLLLDEMEALSCLEDKHLFRASLRLAGELARAAWIS